jgi:hypothetical protein
MSDVKSCPECGADMRWTVLGAMCSLAVLHKQDDGQTLEEFLNIWFWAQTAAMRAAFDRGDDFEPDTSLVTAAFPGTERSDASS